MLDLKGRYVVEIKRANGEVEVIEFDNVVTKEGKNYLLKAGVLGTETPTNRWYVGLIGANVVPSENDKASTALGATGRYAEVTQYAESTRPAYSATFDATNNRITNADSPATFNINATSSINVYGAFIVSNSTKGNSSGILLSAGVFQNPKVLGQGDQLNISYIIAS